MAGRFMKTKRIIIPFMTLAVMTSQLAGCATMTSDEMLKTMQESPEVSIEYAVPDTGQQSLDASQVIGTGDQQHMADSDFDIGLIEDQNNQKLEEISHDELLVVFGQQYEISKEINNSDSAETIQNELEMIRITVECMEKSLPSDYEAQYREWRPSVVQQDTQTTETTQQTQQSQGQQSQSSKPQGNQNKGGSQTQQPQQKEDTSADRGTVGGPPSFGEVITDKSQIATGIDDPYADPAGVQYGGN